MNTKQSIIAIVAAAGCCWAGWQSARAGRARTLGESAMVTSQTGNAEEAVKLSPNDAEAHLVRGILWEREENYAQAQLEVERAVRLRPRDYSVWLLLGIMRDENHDQERALRAFRQSTVLAPAYALPRWQLGNLLLRMGQTDAAFDELRRAASSNPAFLSNAIDLAWGIYGRDAGVVNRVIQPETDATRMALALFYARHNQSAAALDQFRSSRAIAGKSTENLLDELLKTGALGEAYEVWARLHGLPLTSAVEVLNGGFEEAITLGQLGFGWQIATDVSNVTLSVDEGERQKGTRSLRIDFRGNSNPALPLLTQLVLVKPQTKYHLSFAAMGRDLVSAGLPVISVRDASDPTRPMLGQSSPLRSDVAGWRDFSIDVATGAKTEAIILSVERQSCNADPCPAFGALWLDSFLIGGH